VGKYDWRVTLVNTSTPIAKATQRTESIVPRPGLPRLWHTCPKRHAERFPCHTAFSAVPLFLYYLIPASVSILWWICVYIHMSDCAQTVHELPLLPNNTASETYLHKSGAVRSVVLIFINGAPAWRWLGEYVTLDKMFYNLLFVQEVVAAPSYFHIALTRSSSRSLLEI